MVLIHILCWGLPNLLTLISLGFSHLGAASYFYDFEVCSEFGGLAHTIYHDVTYYGLLLLIFCLMVAMFRRILAEEKIGDARVLQPTYLIAKSSLQLYPLSLAICWIPHMVIGFAATGSDSNDVSFKIIFIIAEFLKIFHGSVAAAIFFYKSADARRRWSNLLLGRRVHFMEEDDDSIYAISGTSSLAIETPSIEFNAMQSSIHSSGH